MTNYSNKPSVIQYRDEDFKWWWIVISSAGKVLGRSLRGYTRRVNCSTNMQRLQSAFTPPIKWEQTSERDAKGRLEKVSYKPAASC